MATAGAPAPQGAEERRKARSAVVYCTHGIADPLVAPLMLDYLVRLQQEGAFHAVLLFTEEPPGASVPSWAAALLKDARISWCPMHYDVRGWQWWQRARNLLRMLLSALRFRIRQGKCWQLGYLSFGGAYAIIATMLGLGPCLVVCFEPHSRYMTDLGIWPKDSLKARVVAWTERLQMRRSAALIAPTTAVLEYVRAHGAQGRLALQAITIDTEEAACDQPSRQVLRAQLGIGADAWVVAYVGKFAGIYHTVDQYMAFIGALAAEDAALHFLIITQQEELARIQEHPLAIPLAGRLHLLPPVPPEELSKHLSAADTGVVAIPPTPGQAFRTPVKTAHYWSAGLPIIIPFGVSDDHRIAVQEDTGTAVKDLVPGEAPAVVAAINRWRAGGRETLRERCIRCARQYRDTGAMVRVLHDLLRQAG